MRRHSRLILGLAALESVVWLSAALSGATDGLHGSEWQLTDGVLSERWVSHASTDEHATECGNPCKLRTPREQSPPWPRPPTVKLPQTRPTCASPALRNPRSLAVHAPVCPRHDAPPQRVPSGGRPTEPQTNPSSTALSLLVISSLFASIRLPRSAAISTRGMRPWLGVVGVATLLSHASGHPVHASGEWGGIAAMDQPYSGDPTGNASSLTRCG
jgi:hypothetical protein